MPVAKPGKPGALGTTPDQSRTRQRYRRKIEDWEAAHDKRASKRAAAAKKGAEGPKQSKPGGYSMSYTTSASGKKKRKA